MKIYIFTAEHFEVPGDRASARRTLEGEPRYTVFKRKVWKRERGQWVPFATRGVVVRRGLTLDEARQLCAQGPANMARDAGREYRGLAFYELTQEGR